VSEASEGALFGVRVLDLGIITAGAASSQVLADFGAEVIKIESTTYTDPFRDWQQIAVAGSADDGVTLSPPFASVNRSKLGVAINLKTEEGRAVFLDLVAQSDLVVENFRRGVMERLGIGFDTLRAANPRIVLLSLSSQGLDGPESGYVSFGSTLDALGGVMAVTGYDDDTPLWSGNNVNYPDQLVSFLAPGFALAGLRERDATGEAVHVDAPQREAVTSVIGEVVLDFSRTGQEPVRRANRHAAHAPQGTYCTRGEDQWIAISVTTDAEWVSLCHELGLTDEVVTRWPTAAERREHHDEIDELIGAVSVDQDKVELARRLQARGIPASPVRTAREVLDDEQLAALQFGRAVGDDPVVQRGPAFGLSRTPAGVSSPAPGLGQHTRAVLAKVLGLDDEAIDGLIDTGAVYEDAPASVPSGTPSEAAAVSGTA
jgi:crotonobetainyl-CoA:carnitine CoA-transferase CaiB-like acyl-CoA transferase